MARTPTTLEGATVLDTEAGVEATVERIADPQGTPLGDAAVELAYADGATDTYHYLSFVLAIERGRFRVLEAVAAD